MKLGGLLRCGAISGLVTLSAANSLDSQYLSAIPFQRLAFQFTVGPASLSDDITDSVFVSRLFPGCCTRISK